MEINDKTDWNTIDLDNPEVFNTVKKYFSEQNGKFFLVDANLLPNLKEWKKLKYNIDNA